MRCYIKYLSRYLRNYICDIENGNYLFSQIVRVCVMCGMMKSLTNGIMNYVLIVPILMTAGTVLTSTAFLQTSADSVDYTHGIDIEKHIDINTTT